VGGQAKRTIERRVWLRIDDTIGVVEVDVMDLRYTATHGLPGCGGLSLKRRGLLELLGGVRCSLWVIVD
jgi:hypothetical protein